MKNMKFNYLIESSKFLKYGKKIDEFFFYKLV